MLVAVICALYLPVLSYGFDLPFLTEAKRNRPQQTSDSRKGGLLSEILPRVNAPPRGSGGEHSEVPSRASSQPPRHIVKLLQKMSTDQDLLQRRGNTVRSVVPTKSKSSTVQSLAL